MRYFVECQGYNIDKCIIFQDNMSALSLEKNRRILLSKRSKHIKAKYFLINNYYNTRAVDLRYCPLGHMWADVLMKPLQGQLFRDMWAILQNCLRDYDDDLVWQEDEQVHQSTKHQVTTVTSSREVVGVQSRSSQEKWRTDSPEIVRPKRDASPTCVSWFSPYGVSGKEACNATLELIPDRNMDRQRALVPSH